MSNAEYFRKIAEDIVEGRALSVDSSQESFNRTIDDYLAMRHTDVVVRNVDFRRYNFPKAVEHPRSLPELRTAMIGLGTNPSHVDPADPNQVRGGLIAGIEYEKLLTDLAARCAGFVKLPNGAFAIDETDPNLLNYLRDRVWIARQQAEHSAEWYVKNLGAAQLIHIDPVMMDVVIDAASSAPDDIVINEYDAPAPAGLVVFGKPVYGTDAGPEHTGKEVRVDGLLWGPVRLPKRDVPWYSEDSSNLVIPGFSIASFRLLLPEHDDELGALMGVDSPFWMPLGRSDWVWGDRLDQSPAVELPNSTPAQLDSMKEDRRLLAALWATINQKRLVDIVEVPPDRYVRKRLARARQPERNETVQVIHLRRSEYKYLQETEGGSSGRRITVRFPVKSHYRRQPYGPGRKLRKLILIPAHWKGPDDAPVSHVEKVWEVDR